MINNDIREKAEFLSVTQAYLDQNLFKQAHDLASSWLQQHPMDIDANIFVCKALVKMGKLDKLEEILESVNDAILQFSRIYAAMGDICLEGGLTREAVRFYQKFVSINPESVVTQKISAKLQGLTLTPDELLGRTEEKDNESIGHVASDFYTVTLADLYISQGHLQMAKDVLHKILQNDPGTPMISERLNDLETMMNNKKLKGVVIEELTRWLQNIGRIGHYVSG
jgi:tetratricopeptide (TPR) repeat protein